VEEWTVIERSGHLQSFRLSGWTREFADLQASCSAAPQIGRSRDRSIPAVQED